MMISKYKCTFFALLFIALPTYTDETAGAGPNMSPSCPIVKPVCPVFNGENGARVTSGIDSNNPGSLRYAIDQANKSKARPEDPFVIEFDLPADDNRIVIEQSDLIIKKPVCINGFTNNGASEFERTITVELCTSDPDTVINGLTLTSTACSSTIKGLAIFGFSSSGILVHASGSLIAGNNIGAVDEEIMACPNSNNANNTGITIDNAEHVTIGGLCPHERNIISGNEVSGITIKSNNVTVVGNYIGTDTTGLLSAQSGQLTGIIIDGNCNIIGCRQKCGGNLIASHGDQGVLVIGSYNKIVNATIGLDRQGKRSLANTQGVKIEGNYNTILDSVISGNKSIFGTGIDNANIAIQGSFNTVRHCLIGTDPKGKKSFASPFGIKIGFGTTGMISLEKSTNNLIEDNLISVRSGVGIQIAAGSSNIIRKNLIGSNRDETCSLGQSIGIDLESLDCTVDALPIDHSRLPYSRYEHGSSAHAVYPQRPHGQSQPRSYVLDEDMQPYQRHSSVSQYATELHPRLRAQTSGTCPRPCGTCDLEELQPGCCQNLPFATETVANCITGNTILGNLCYGIRLDNATRFTKIEKNLIGASKRCHFVPNGYGIFITNGAQNNSIKCNLIAGNLFNGIGIQGIIPFNEFELFPQTINNTISKNRIFGNCRSGIRLSAGGNDCLGAPLIVFAEAVRDVLTVTIEAASLPENVPFAIELYGNTRCRKCVSEGERFLCCTTIQEPLTQDELRIVTPLSCPELEFVTATVTQLTSCFASGNTSEFSCPVRIISPTIDDVRITPLLESSLSNLGSLT